MFDVSFPIAFSAGVVSFFAPCFIPLLPVYISYVTGVSINDLKEKGYNHYLKKLLSASLFYILGFSSVFIILGTTAAGFGSLFRRYDLLIQKVGGLVLLLLGLEFAGILNFSFLAKTKQFAFPSSSGRGGPWHAFMVGLIFAVSWTPCIGVVLGSILALAAVSATALKGASLLFVYSLGISLPFIIVSLTLASAPKYLSFISHHIRIITKGGGLILVILGILLLTDTYKYLNSWIFELFFRFGYKIR